MKVLILFCLFCMLILEFTVAYNKKKCNDKPSYTGPCKAAFRMWRYIKENNVCEAFIYGGCRGTHNLFDSEKDCIEECVS